MALTTKDLPALLKKHPLVAGCALLSLILLVGSYIRSSRLSELSYELKQTESEGQRVLDNIRNGANLPEQFDAISAATKDLESRLVRGTERARNQQYFYRLESETQVKEVNLQPVSSSGPQRGLKTIYAGVGYSVAVEGDYRRILGFLQRIESGPHFCRIISGSISRRGQRGVAESTPTITLSLSVELLGLP